MKVTIAPSTPAPGFNTISIDTNSNEETTDEAVQAVLDAIILFGHDYRNVKEAASGYADNSLYATEP